ncbi:hypothetical protein DB88DRAFT_484211 [Papiliotrema laurentii]|uniref:Uncharacterized protein n=1 Tax=Papiliotrema laurentii TaxID=5418 RepID=A0AAD9L7G6_PAPLA|nr:hypothetical protein DB88DRAFT_484211 [Papiliotrema laurentii]
MTFSLTLTKTTSLLTFTLIPRLSHLRPSQKPCFRLISPMSLPTRQPKISNRWLNCQISSTTAWTRMRGGKLQTRSSK